MELISAKIVFIGDTNVGKTSLCYLFHEKKIALDETKMYPTVGGAFFRKKEEFMGNTLLLDIWDTAGQERYHSIAPIYFRNADVGIFMFDVNQPVSFLSIKKWKTIFDKVASENSISFLVGNKIDLENKIKDMNNYGFTKDIVYTSSKTGEGVEDFYKKMLDGVITIKEKKKENQIIEISKDIDPRNCSNCFN